MSTEQPQKPGLERLSQKVCVGSPRRMSASACAGGGPSQTSHRIASPDPGMSHVSSLSRHAPRARGVFIAAQLAEKLIELSSLYSSHLVA